MTKYRAHLLSLGVAYALLATPASAAGPLPAPTDPVPTAPAPATDWTGAYGGLSFGVAFGRGAAELGDYHGDVIERDVAIGLFPQDIDGSESNAIGGFNVGYNVQRESFVGGIEFDVSFLNQDIDNEFTEEDPDQYLEVTDTNTGYNTEIDGLATLRLRAGFARDRDLFYGTAGLAAGQVRNEFSLELPGLMLNPEYSSSWSNSDTLYGYVIGAGYERRITDRLSVKGEVLYYDLEDVTIEARDPDTFQDQAIDYQFANDGYIARIGINMSF